MLLQTRRTGDGGIIMACEGQDEPLSFKPWVDELGTALARLDQFHFARASPWDELTKACTKKSRSLEIARNYRRGHWKWPIVWWLLQSRAFASLPCCFLREREAREWCDPSFIIVHLTRSWISIYWLRRKFKKLMFFHISLESTQSSQLWQIWIDFEVWCIYQGQTFIRVLLVQLRKKLHSDIAKDREGCSAEGEYG